MLSRELFISDLDGTLLDSSGKLPTSVCNELNELIGQGMSFTFATARTIYSAGPITKGLNVNVPCILNNGASVYDIASGRYVKNNYISVTTAYEIIRAFHENNVRCFVFKFFDGKLATCYDEVADEQMQNYVNKRKKEFDQPFVACRDVTDENDGSAIYINSIGTYESLLPVRERIRAINGADCAFYEDTYSDKWYLETFSSEASKANGVKFLREEYGFETVTAFGDNLNDLSLFSASDRRIAVKNAVDELKKSADIILPFTNDENAVSRELKSILNK